MPEDRAVNIAVRAKDEGAKAKIDSLGDTLKKLVADVPGINGALGALATGAAAIGTAFAAASKAVSEFAGAQQGVARLDAALARAGQLTDEYRERLQDLASELSKATAIADDEWLSVLTKLTQFGANPKTIGMDVEAVKNLAGVVGDLETAAGMYAKALQGNFQAFSRYGIVVGEAGTQTEKLNLLWSQLARIGGGQLEAKAESLAGKFEYLKLQMGEVMEAVGGGIAKQLKLADAAEFAGNAFEWWAETMGDTIEKLSAIQNVTQDATTSTSAYIEQLKLVAQLSERIAKATDEETAAIRRKQSAQDEIADAQMALDIAQVDEAVRSGKMSSSQGIRRKAGIRKAAAAAKISREEASDIAVMDANERGLADEMKAREALARRRDALRKEIGAGSIAESRANRAQQTIRDLTALKENIQAGGETLWDRLPAFLGRAGAGPMGEALASAIGARDRDRSIAEIDKAIGIAQRIGPASLGTRRQELSAIEDQIGKFDTSIAGRRSLVVSANDAIAEKALARRQVYGLNSQRDQVVTGGEYSTARQSEVNAALDAAQKGLGTAGRAVGGTVQEFQRSSDAMLDFATTSAAIHQRNEQRLRALEQQIKATANR